MRLIPVLLCLIGLCSAYPADWMFYRSDIIGIYPVDHVEPPYGLTLEDINETMRAGYDVYVYKDTGGIDTIYVSKGPLKSNSKMFFGRGMFGDSCPEGIDLMGRHP